MENENNYEDEDMTVDLTLEDDTTVTCKIITILTVAEKDYIALLPQQESKNDEDEDEVWFYEYSENPNDPNEDPLLTYIEDDEVYEAVTDAFDEFLDNCDFDDM